jgi:hypothetical protein
MVTEDYTSLHEGDHHNVLFLNDGDKGRNPGYYIDRLTSVGSLQEGLHGPFPTFEAAKDAGEDFDDQVNLSFAPAP